MTKLLGSLVLAAMAVALTPKSALAEQGVPINASFTVAFTRTLNTGNATFCGTAVLLPPLPPTAPVTHRWAPCPLSFRRP